MNRRTSRWRGHGGRFKPGPVLDVAACEGCGALFMPVMFAPGPLPLSPLDIAAQRRRCDRCRSENAAPR